MHKRFLFRIATLLIFISCYSRPYALWNNDYQGFQNYIDSIVYENIIKAEQSLNFTDTVKSPHNGRIEHPIHNLSEEDIEIVEFLSILWDYEEPIEYGFGLRLFAEPTIKLLRQYMKTRDDIAAIWLYSQYIKYKFWYYFFNNLISEDFAKYLEIENWCDKNKVSYTDSDAICAKFGKNKFTMQFVECNKLEIQREAIRGLLSF